ncbi:keratin, type I cytoskeletal 18-like [Rhinatrema bivittatum]|uniref:keratin, type I cytoskeletal 18-like n=1 Tax=Rhinatrema bivittatum TaxID=194408 RepID=UPI0011280331|nr:keratin, type I cytoskeletal 18-like [Rhinatrema bivittatum]
MASPTNSGFCCPSFNKDAAVANDKEMMQNLNDRLATYLEKVRSLEKLNQELEIQIKEKLAQQVPAVKDYDSEFSQTNSLRKEIQKLILHNTKLLLAIDNAKLATADFKIRWKSEMAMSQSMENDISALRKLKGQHESCAGTLTVQLESLEEELLSLKKNHKEELTTLKASLAGSRVDVEVDPVQGLDLALILADVRSQYEAVIQKNKEEANPWFQAQLNTLTLQAENENKALRRANKEVTEKRHSLQGLEIELESLKIQVNAMKSSLEETECRYKGELDGLQTTINRLETELAEIQRSMQNEGLEYENLLRIKETLEAEIEVYRRLLDGEDEKKMVKPPPKKEPNVTTRKIVKVVTQTVVDGKVIDEYSEVEEMEESKKLKAPSFQE